MGSTPEGEKMSQVTYLSEKTAKKRVEFYNGTGASVTLQGGYALCYDHSQTDKTQAYRVVQPATLNLKYFAGVVCAEEAGKVVADGDTIVIDIYIPTKYGQVVPVWNTEDHSANTAVLEITDGAFELLEGATNPVCRTVALTDRTTPGTILSRLYGLSDPLA